jgi:bifunctional oligoribonuclease and PAP phosphatase NrnA
MPHGTGKPLGRYSSVVPSKARQSARRVARALEKANRILVAGHVGADGDVVGSSLAMTLALREMGKKVILYNELPYPPAFAWLPGGRTLKLTVSARATFDAVVAVDAADENRCGAAFPDSNRRGKFIWIDHHAHPQPPGDINFIDLTSAAVGEQIVMVVDAMGHPLSKKVAQCVYASLMSDTGVFRYGNTSARAFRLAGRLVECGVDPWEMTQRIYESQDEERMRLLGRTLENLWVSEDGRFGIARVLPRDMRDSGANLRHIHGLVNHIRGIKGIEVAFLLHKEENATRVISRSRGNISCHLFAQPFGAKGHKNAASFLAKGSLAQVQRKLISSLPVLS